ncbi:DUF3846 domain-containing protein [Kocuria marina]|uniref:DUF3846 domain-containing protein n=1 Tax=Kocuria marina TaxID=223184 RepID=UPI00346140E5
MTTTTPTKTGLFIPADPDTAHEVRELDASRLLNALQTTVGGYVEVVTLTRLGADMYLNEEGKVMSLPVNERATWLARALGAHLIPGDCIAGDVLILGGPDEDGDNQGLTPLQVQEIKIALTYQR